ncbi:DNA polymerase/3'-5' exonuclease PolX [Bdellovibrionota bacterium FG-2]
MAIHNSEIAACFEEIADILEIQGENEFRVRAYRNAARVITGSALELSELIAKGEALPKMSGVGKDLGQKIAEFVTTGKIALLEELTQKIPVGVLELLKIPGLGPKRVRTLMTDLKIQGIDDLKKALKEKRVVELPGFGEKIAHQLYEGIVKKMAQAKLPTRVLWVAANQLALPMLEYIRAIPGVKQAEVAGSLRRRLETVGDLDILVEAAAGSKGHTAILKTILEYEDIEAVLARGPKKLTFVLRGYPQGHAGMHVDVRLVSEREWGAALHYFTGSKAHNIAVRTMAMKKGLRISEYGVYKGARWVSGAEETDIFKTVGLSYIPPELRENAGEIEASLAHKLRSLVLTSHIRGDLHCHTTASDGRKTLQEMAAKARALGYEYLAVTDHSQRLTVGRGLEPKRLWERIREIDRFNELNDGLFRILKSAEVDILEDGALDYDDELLAALDWVVCSVHSRFKLTREKQAERIIRAMDHPHFHVLAHPTGRLLLEREPYDIDIEKILQAARERGCFLELNSQPERLDLNDVHCKLAKALGVKVVISSDAHDDHELDFMPLGIAQARRGGLEASDVVNTRSWSEIKKLLRRH